MADISRIISDAKQGKMFILLDDADRENEGDLIIAAELVNPQAINFMMTYGRGIICLSITEKLRQKLELGLLPKRNKGDYDTGFANSFDAKSGVTTGVSAYDRSLSINVAVKGDKDSICTPGHIFPVVEQPEGLKVRRGHTEASVEIMRMAGFKEPAAVICEIILPNGNMARFSDIESFSMEHQINVATVNDVIKYMNNGV